MRVCDVVEREWVCIYVYGHFFWKVPHLGKTKKTPEGLCFQSISQKIPNFYIMEDSRCQTYNFKCFWLLKCYLKKLRISNFSILNHISQDWRVIWRNLSNFHQLTTLLSISYPICDRALYFSWKRWGKIPVM